MTLLRCVECAAPLEYGQHYCLECGARHGPVPEPVAMLMAGGGLYPETLAATIEPTAAVDAGPFGRLIFEPRVAAIAVMSLLAFGVLVGSAVSPAEDTGAASAILVSLPPAASAPPAAIAATPAAPVPPVTATPAPAAAQAATPAAPKTTTIPTAPTPATTVAPALPAVKHVFLIVLSDHGFADAWGPGSKAPYLSTTLRGQGELLQNYYAVTPGALANGIALLSGQGPDPQTAANCPQFTDFAPATPGKDGQLVGNGCVYPRQAQTLAGQLTGAAKSSKAYVEDIASGGAGAPTACRHPAIGAADPAQAPRPGDAYVTWRNPFVYFHAQIDDPACATNDVELAQLTTDLKAEGTTPAFSYIVPNRCHDGADAPCADGQPAGLAAADAWLKTVVPAIENSPGYKTGGLIAITFDEAPQTGPGADSSGCCSTPTFPNLPAPTASTTPAGSAGAASQAGGGRVGLLLISSFVTPGSANNTDDYNHYSLLRSVEDLFGLDHLGYAASPALLPFDKTVYNAKR